MKTEDLAIHPYAQRFPLLDDQELTDLATSIQESGLMDPIVTDIIDGVETILDGRNRLAACELANMDPQFETFDAFCARTACCFAGPVSFIAAKNIRRRHLTHSVAVTLALEAVDEAANENGDQPIGLDDPDIDVTKNYPETGPGDELAAEFAEETKAGSDEDQSKPAHRPKTPRGQAQDKVSDDTGIGKKDLRRAETLRGKRPDLFKKVSDGKMNLHAAEEKMQKDQKVEAVAAERKEALKLISDETQPFRDAVARGQMLKRTKDIVGYAALKRDEKPHIRNLLGAGWGFSKAREYMDMEVTEKTTIKKLIGLACYGGGRLEVVIDGHCVTVEKAGKAVEK